MFSSAPKKPMFAPDLAAATFNGAYVAQELEHASNFAEETAKALQTTKNWEIRFFWGFIILLLGFVCIGIWYGFYVAGWVNWFIGIDIPYNYKPPTVPNLVITEAFFTVLPLIPGMGPEQIDITDQISAAVIDETLNITLNNATISEIPTDAKSTDTITIQFYYDQCSVKTPITKTFFALQQAVINTVVAPCPGSKQSSTHVGSSSPVTAPNWFSSFFAGQGSSGNLLPNTLDTTTSTTVKASSAPLSSGNDGAYGMQWWMFIKDWNYGYGKDKQVLTRADPTNSSILNPSVSLHPTDNSLRVSISIFPDSPDGSSKATPAPAGHSGSTDDVFVCEVPNLPLQDWFAVSMTVSGRNLDVYIDGKLVKSCFLPGVPKPASGDITVAGAGGFSGSMCGFKHYSRMLTPGDAVNFSGNGTNCKASTGPSDVSKATGYSVKFGMYDNVGKKVEEYTF